MERQFLFVDSTSNDRQARKLARSHAMKGKNAGKKIHRRSRLEAFENTRSSRKHAEQDAGRVNLAQSIDILPDPYSSSRVVLPLMGASTPKEERVLRQC